LFQFWGPATSINATRWIADAAIKVDQRHNPTLTLVYLPHLDYGLQRTSTEAAGIAQDLRDVDAECGKLIDYFTARGARVILLSEYGVMPVSRPVHLNRVLRELGCLTIREELGREILDAGESAAFAVADHQIAHIYVNDLSRFNEVRKAIESTAGVETVLDADGKKLHHLDHPRSGELIAIASPDAWFTYYYWLDDSRAPDFARTVDIHRKPGYDPAELYLDPAIRYPKAKIAWALARRKLGQRALMEVIPLDATLVRGSHGHAPISPKNGPVFATSDKQLLTGTDFPATEVYHAILRHLSA